MGIRIGRSENTREQNVLGQQKRPTIVEPNKWATQINFPAFIRFNAVALRYNLVTTSTIATKCEKFPYYLKLARGALRDTIATVFRANIDKNAHEFCDFRQLAKHLESVLLPICDPSREYIINICFRDKSQKLVDDPNPIASILQMQQIACCPLLELRFYTMRNNFQICHLAVTEISAWLNTTTKNKSEKHLRLFIELMALKDIVELWKCLKQVIAFFLQLNDHGLIGLAGD